MPKQQDAKQRGLGDDGSENPGLVPQLRQMLRALVKSPVFFKVMLLAAGVVLVIAATAFEQIRLNEWNQPFYNALSYRDWTAFTMQLEIFAQIVCVLLALNVAQRWLGETLKVKLREGLVRDLVKEWLEPRRAFKLANAGPIGVNPDQRMHEDARRLTELSTDLGIGLLQATILLAVFVKVLWTLSDGFIFQIAGRSISIPGYMVWAAIIYAGSASLLSYWFGRSLIEQNAARYSREAGLRFTLMQANEHMEAITLSHGEADEIERIDVDLSAVLQAMRRLVVSLTRLTWVTSGYGWFTLVAPILVAAPIYYAGELSFGGLMMAVGAFNQVQSSLRWFVDNFSVIADWRASLLRVASFRAATIAADSLHKGQSRIEFVSGPPGVVTFEGLELLSPGAGAKLESKRIEIRKGDRLLITGETGTNKETLFRALAGLWPWGVGRICWPKGETVLFVPETPYLPRASLRAALAYPSKPERFEDANFRHALERMGLERLTNMLGDVRRWDHELNADERLALAFARILLHPADWVVIDEALGFMERTMLDRVANVIEQDLKNAGVIYLGDADMAQKLKARTERLIPDPQARHLRRGEIIQTSDSTTIQLPENV